jgi:hypothetical protein
MKHNPPSKTITVMIQAKPSLVYSYVRNGFNLPNWAKSFCKTVERGEDRYWNVKTYNGVRRIRFVEDNPLGVLDHYVVIQNNPEYQVPMRVLEVQGGCEVQITLFRQPQDTDETFSFKEKVALEDLNSLREVIESGKHTP